MGEGLDDRQQGIGGQRGRFVDLGPDDLLGRHGVSLGVRFPPGRPTGGSRGFERTVNKADSHGDSPASSGFPVESDCLGLRSRPRDYPSTGMAAPEVARTVPRVTAKSMRPRFTPPKPTWKTSVSPWAWGTPRGGVHAERL